MRRRHLELLRCPACGGRLEVAGATREEGDLLLEAELGCAGCGRAWPVREGVGVFVEDEAYVESFGWQWTRFARLQRDSYNGTDLVRRTILKRSGWEPADLAGKLVLECGAGSGNDTEVLAELAGTLVSMDLSRAVFAMPEELRRREDVLVLRADLHRPPLDLARFDVVYCHRVIQHTPDPAAAFAALARNVRPGGQLFLHSYDTHWKSLCNYKYLWRPLTRRLPHGLVYRALRLVGPPLYLLAGALNRLAFLRRAVRLLIPFENHARALKKAGATLTARERYEYAFLITFDALTPRHDHPSSPETVRGWFERAGFEDVDLRFRNPVIAVGWRPLAPAEVTPPAARASALRP